MTICTQKDEKETAVTEQSGRKAVKREKKKVSENIDAFHPAYAAAILALTEEQQSARAEGTEKDCSI